MYVSSIHVYVILKMQTFRNRYKNGQNVLKKKIKKKQKHCTRPRVFFES